MMYDHDRPLMKTFMDPTSHQTGQETNTMKHFELESALSHLPWARFM